ncbi:MAG: hypothetical protein IJU76_01010 [Desulfovibrionaceae bacterium]|nr:hypothetical protein [Desulfovibrionaceae bacterium]
MKFFETKQSLSLSRTHLFLIALCVALGMWYAVTKQEMAETQVEILLSYHNIPRELFITSGLVYKVKERIRGPKMLIYNLPTAFHLPIDCSQIKLGSGLSNTFSITDELRKATKQHRLRAFKILDVDHPTITLQAERIDNIGFPLSLRYRSNNDLIVRTTHQSSSTVVLSGPESEIAHLKTLSLWELDIHVDLLDVGKGEVQKEIPIIIPFEKCPHVTSKPTSVAVGYEILGERIKTTWKYDVTLSVADPNRYHISPPSVDVVLKVPQNKENDAEYLKQLRVTAFPPNMQEGESKRVYLSFTPPEGMEVLNDKMTVTVTRLSDRQVKPDNHVTSPEAQQKQPVHTEKKKRSRKERTEK